MFYALDEHDKNLVIVANKVDKLKKSEYLEQFQRIQKIFENHKVIAYSAEKKIGIRELTEAILS